MMKLGGWYSVEKLAFHRELESFRNPSECIAYITGERQCLSTVEHHYQSPRGYEASTAQ